MVSFRMLVPMQSQDRDAGEHRILLTE
jgi:hypothetical protein